MNYICTQCGGAVPMQPGRTIPCPFCQTAFRKPQEDWEAEQQEQRQVKQEQANAQFNAFFDKVAQQIVEEAPQPPTEEELQALAEQAERQAVVQLQRRAANKKRLLGVLAVLVVIAIGVGVFFAVDALRFNARANANALYLQENVEVGAVVNFGMHDDGTPAQWQVLDVQDNRALLLLDGIIVIRINGTLPSAGHTCAMRSALNWWPEQRRSFYNSRLHVTLASYEYNRVRVDHNERFFLLSVEEVERYFPNPQDRVSVIYLTPPVFPTAAAARFSVDGANAWYLRTPYRNYLGVYGVGRDGEIEQFERSIQVRDGTAAFPPVRPAMWIRIN